MQLYNYHSLCEIIQTHKFNFDKPAWVIGSSQNLETLSKDRVSGIKIGIGDTPIRAPIFGPYDFWVTANTIYPLPWIKKHQDQLKKINSHILFSSVCVNNNEINLDDVVNSINKLREFTSVTLYDTRHFRGVLCQPRDNCCKLFSKLQFGPTIQELLGAKIINKHPAYSTGGTVALHGLALAVLLNCNPIYLAGIELPEYEKDYKYFKDFYQPHLSRIGMVKRYFRNFFIKVDQHSVFSGVIRNDILRDFEIIGKIAKSLGITVFVTSQKSTLLQFNEFKFIEANFDNLFPLKDL